MKIIYDIGQTEELIKEALNRAGQHVLQVKVLKEGGVEISFASPTPASLLDAHTAYPIDFVTDRIARAPSVINLAKHR